MLLRAAAVALAAAFLLAGCTNAPKADVTTPTQVGMTIVGLVQNETFAPIPAAKVALRFTNHTATTDAGGLFKFTGLTLAPYLVDVQAVGFLNATLNAEPRSNVSLSFILGVPLAAAPPPTTLHFAGKFECALEAFIITPSCDTVIEFVRDQPQAPPLPDLFEDVSTFDFFLAPRWSTVVLDVDFDSQPGLDGLRVTVQGRNDADQLAAYEQYGRFHDAAPFTIRLEPGGTYDDGAKALPANATILQLEVYPQGHGWHAGCTPPAPNVQPCPLGVGFAQSMQFDVYVTIFYVDPAPADFTLL